MDRYDHQIQKAKKAFENHNPDEAIRLYEEAFRDKIMIEDMIDLGLICMDNSNPLKAYQVFQSVSELFPDSPYGYYGLGLVCEDIGKPREALGHYETAISIDPSFCEAYFNIALLSEDLGDDARAYEFYQKTLACNPDHFWANLNLGTYYEKNGKLELALSHTLKAYKINPQEKMVSYNLGVYYSKMKQYDLARDYYREEISKPDGYLMAYLNLGLLYKDVYHDYGNARSCYLQGIRKDRENPTLWYNLGCLYTFLKDDGNAYDCLLYANLRDRTLVAFMETDEELTRFRKTDYYQKLLQEIARI